MLAIALFGIAFAVRAVVGSMFVGPAYPDSYYYAHVAEQLAAGKGFVTQYLWNLDDIGRLVPAPGVLPATANGFWMPLAEIVQVPFVWLLSAGPLAAALPFWIIGALAAPLTFLVGRDAGLSRFQAVAAALLVCAPGGLTPFMSQPDSFGLFMTLGVLALWLCARGAAGDRRAFMAGGVVVGLAALTRVDGVLLGLPFAFIGFREIWRALRGRPIALGWAPAVGCAALFLVVLSPWLLRQLATYGSILPGSATVWLTDYQQLFSFGDKPTLEAFLALGPGQLLSTRVDALLTAIGLFAVLPLSFVLAPLVIVGAWTHRRSNVFQPFFIYCAALVALMVLAFAPLVAHGTFIHAAAALVPHSFVLVVAGLAAVVRWVAERRPAWSAATATRRFTAAAVAIAFVVAGLQTVSTTRQWSDVRAVQEALAERLREAPRSDRFMAVDPGAMNYLTGLQGIVTPHDELPVIESVMSTYDVRWLVVESRSIVPSLKPILAGATRPWWLSQPVAIVPGTPLSAVAGPTPTAVPAGVLFAVCLSDGDRRCSP
ncbi:MAG TPA: hypothetical protein VEX62_04020 [Candidatus Limnocylindrales bacterium]|nr:hypothetical protein [Candidatus Limnocylindrales bacterium]